MEVKERLSLEAVSADTLIASEHVHRYEFAARLCVGQRVVDLCCGSGYGSVLLARTARSVVGVDVDVATIEEASRVSDGVRFVAADAHAYLRALDPAEVDAVICFEGLEHLPNLDETARELARLANSGVQLILTVPNSVMWDEVNEFHMTNFSYDSATELFARVGADTMLVQYLAEGSVIVAPGDASPSGVPEFRWPERIEPEYANHLLGIANGDPAKIRASTSGRLAITYAPTYNRHVRNIERANNELWRTNARLGREAFAHSGAAAAARIKRQERDAAEVAAKIADLENQADTLRAELAEREERLRVTDEVLQRYIAAAQRRASRPTRRVVRAIARRAMRASGRGTMPGR